MKLVLKSTVETVVRDGVNFGDPMSCGICVRHFSGGQQLGPNSCGAFSQRSPWTCLVHGSTIRMFMEAVSVSTVATVVKDGNNSVTENANHVCEFWFSCLLSHPLFHGLHGDDLALGGNSNGLSHGVLLGACELFFFNVAPEVFVLLADEFLDDDER